MTASNLDTKSRNLLAGSAIGILAVILVLYIGSFRWLVEQWLANPDYIYAFIVPVFSGWLLWDRRDLLKLDQIQGSYWGAPVIVVSGIAAIYCDWHFQNVEKALTLIPLLAGFALLIGGWHALQWSWPSIVFLFFMNPLPDRVSGPISRSLQSIGTRASVFLLETLGMEVSTSGNVIQLKSIPLEVADACSGIRMLMLFIAACVGAAFYLRHRDTWTRVIIVLSSPVIAIVSNVLRITVTAMLTEWVNPQLGTRVFHELAGWMMMPVAIGLLWLETALLDRLFISPEEETPISLSAATLGLAPRRPSEGESKGNESQRE